MTKMDKVEEKCPNCGRGIGPGAGRCPECGVSTEREHNLDQELVKVWEPPDQMAALAAVALLEEQGIEAAAKSEQIAMYDGLAMMMRPRWGQVLVLERDSRRAREILEDFVSEASDDGRAGKEAGED